MNCVTDAQIEEFLTNPSRMIRLGAVVNYYFRMTPEQIDRALIDSDEYIRMACINRMQGRLSPEQINFIMNSRMYLVRACLANQPYYTPTQDQAIDGLNDESIFVQQIFMNRWYEWVAQREARRLKNRHPSSIMNQEMTNAL